MGIATSCTTHMGIVVVPDEASPSYVRVVMMFASSYPCTFTHLHQGLPPGMWCAIVRGRRICCLVTHELAPRML